MSEGRLKIGSSFLKIGEQFLRIGPPPEPPVNPTEILYIDSDTVASGSGATLDLSTGVVGFSVSSWLLGIYLQQGRLQDYLTDGFISVTVGDANALILIGEGGVDGDDWVNGYLIYEVTSVANEFTLQLAIDANPGVNIAATLFAVRNGVFVDTGTPDLDPFVSDDVSAGFQIYAGEDPVAEPAGAWSDNYGVDAIEVVMDADFTFYATTLNPPSTSAEQTSPANAEGVAVEYTNI